MLRDQKVKFVDGRITKADTTADIIMFISISPSDEIPCKHVFAYREYHYQPLFDEDLTHGRWNLINYKKPIVLAFN